jgi:hypothetical protein
MRGMQVGIKTGMNHIDKWRRFGSMSDVIQKVESRGGMATQDELVGLQLMGEHIAKHIQLIAQDPNEKQRVKEYGDDLGKAMNMVKAYGQRIQEAQKKAMQAGQGGNGGPDPKEMAKIQGMQMQSQAKAENTRESHAQRTAQRQVQWQMEMQRKKDEHAIEMKRMEAELAAELQAQGVKTGAEIENNRLKAETAASDKTE